MLNEVTFTSSTEEDLKLAKISWVQFQLQKTGINVVLEDKSIILQVNLNITNTLELKLKNE